MVLGVVWLHAEQDRVLIHLSGFFPALRAQLPPEPQDSALAIAAPAEHRDPDPIAPQTAHAPRPQIKVGKVLKPRGRRRGRGRGVAVMLRWTRVRGARAYHVQLSRNPGFEPTVVDTEVGRPRLLKKKLPPGSYFVRARAKTATEYGPFSEPYEVASAARGSTPTKRRRRGNRGRSAKRRRGTTQLALR
jgi:hypothetical protein